MSELSNNQIVPFNFNSKEIRVVSIDGVPWFVAKDVAEILGYKNHSDAIARHCRGVAKHYPIIDSLGRAQEVRVISEPDVYRLIIRSNLPEAEKFEEWVMGEVLPSIRKTGSYQMPNFSDPAEAARAWALQYEATQLAIATKAEIGSRREATSMNTASQAVKKATKLEQELDKAKEYISIKRMEMLYHGTKFEWRKLKSTAIEMDLPSIDVFDANYGTVKAYNIEVWKETYAIDPDL